MPLFKFSKWNNKQINYELLNEIDLKPTYFKFLKNFIFYQTYPNENKNNNTMYI